jgi:hypothetical protein
MGIMVGTQLTPRQASERFPPKDTGDLTIAALRSAQQMI